MARPGGDSRVLRCPTLSRALGSGPGSARGRGDLDLGRLVRLGDWRGVVWRLGALGMPAAPLPPRYANFRETIRFTSSWSGRFADRSTRARLRRSMSVGPFRRREPPDVAMLHLHVHAAWDLARPATPRLVHSCDKLAVY